MHPGDSDSAAPPLSAVVVGGCEYTKNVDAAEFNGDDVGDIGDDDDEGDTDGVAVRSELANAVKERDGRSDGAEATEASEGAEAARPGLFAGDRPHVHS